VTCVSFLKAPHLIFLHQALTLDCPLRNSPGIAVAEYLVIRRTQGAAKMMLKITKIQESRRDVLIKLEGKITDQWAVLLDGECRSYLRQKKAVHLDCSHVDFIDARGIEVLNILPQAQVSLMSAPGFITELLQIGGRS
jgi:ABC-type transporter Mla MlaB component